MLTSTRANNYLIILLILLMLQMAGSEINAEDIEKQITKHMKENNMKPYSSNTQQITLAAIKTTEATTTTTRAAATTTPGTLPTVGTATALIATTTLIKSQKHHNEVDGNAGNSIPQDVQSVADDDDVDVDNDKQIITLNVGASNTEEYENLNMTTIWPSSLTPTENVNDNIINDDDDDDDEDDNDDDDEDDDDDLDLEFNEDGVLIRPPSEILIKGFSIPTYLPPYPLFEMSDLHANRIATTTSKDNSQISSSAAATAASSSSAPAGYHVKDIYQQHQDQLYTDAQHQQQDGKNSTRTTTLETIVQVQMGNHAYLPCHISRNTNKSVSWVRLRDGHIISVDQTTFIADQRFQAIYQNDNNNNNNNNHNSNNNTVEEESQTWSLQIKYVQAIDDGLYECQMATEPKQSIRIYLKVVVPITELIGDQSRFVKASSKVALHCIVRGTLEPPTFIIWYHGAKQIMADNDLGWYTEIDRMIFGNVSSTQNTIGSLIIPFVRKKDSGNYTCQPSNSQAVTVDLHVLSGEYSASAIMSAANQFRLNVNYLIVLLLLMALQKT